ncbi:ISCU [Branchiostoma lanceolatum]|uniref:ISCU protein n=1 Tax=Branchiostoma lanceolatum TaxID=7740 RepID=A0A8J9VXW3_BRALA|nr:ISCU [Branchiostoma lanceolatum]
MSLLRHLGKSLRPMVGARATAVPTAGYHENVIDHYENPRNVGSMDKNDKKVGTGLVGAPACGDVMKLQILIDDDGKIVDAKFKTFGCGSAIASSSLATEWVKGKWMKLLPLRTQISPRSCVFHLSSCTAQCSLKTPSELRCTTTN